MLHVLTTKQLFKYHVYASLKRISSTTSGIHVTPSSLRNVLCQPPRSKQMDKRPVLSAQRSGLAQRDSRLNKRPA